MNLKIICLVYAWIFWCLALKFKLTILFIMDRAFDVILAYTYYVHATWLELVSSSDGTPSFGAYHIQTYRLEHITYAHMLSSTLIQMYLFGIEQETEYHSKHGLLQRTTKTPNLICIDNHHFRQMQIMPLSNAMHFMINVTLWHTSAVMNVRRCYFRAKIRFSSRCCGVSWCQLNIYLYTHFNIRNKNEQYSKINNLHKTRDRLN